MGWNIVEISATLFECLVSVDFVTRYLGWKDKNKKSYVGYILTFIILVFTSFFLNYITLFEGVAGLIYPAIAVIYGIFFLDGSIYEKIVIACIDNGINMITSVAVLTIFNYISHYKIEQLITNEGAIRILIILTAKGSYFFFTRMILRLQRKNKFALSSMEWVAIFGVFIMSFITGVMVFEILILSPKNNNNDLLAVGVAITLIIINVLCYYIFVNISAKNREKLNYSLKELQLADQEKSLKEMKLFYEQVRKTSHDMKNYMECAIHLLHNEKYQEAEQYLSTLLENKICLGNQFVFTNSVAVNAVINSKISLCKQQGIHMDYKISGNVKAIPELDLSILLANLLDNAIEACSKLVNGAIKLNIQEDRNYLMIYISNTIKESVLARNPNLHSTKLDKQHHGLGTLSIKDIVKQHNGIMKYYEENNQFISDIWLKLN